MSFGGGSSTPLPQAQPVIPVPQPDDPKLLDSQRKAAKAAENREGYSAHLLTNGEDDPLSNGTSADSGKAKLIG